MTWTVVVIVAMVAYFVWRHYQTNGGIGQLRQRAPKAQAYEVPIVGESNYQAALTTICNGRTRDGVEKYVKATLSLEDANPYDRNAVRVDVQGHQVGYLSRDFAPTYRAWLKRAGRSPRQATYDAVIRGGWDRGEGDTGHFGVRLDIPWS